MNRDERRKILHEIASSPKPLYALTDCALSGMSHLEQVRRFLDAGVRLVQLREKSGEDAPLLAEASRCAQLCRQAGALFIINDRIALAVACGADGVHIGQEDTPPSVARSLLHPELVLGLSTHNPVQFTAALSEPVDYIAVGPVFGTATKQNPDPATGLGLVNFAWKHCCESRIPLVAIGGIHAGNSRSVREAAPGAILAVISGFLKNGEIEANVSRIVDELR